MCGLAGIAELSGAPLPPDGLAREMASRLAHRGPDGEGNWDEPTFSLSFRRLAVIDPSAPPAPYTDESGRIIAAVNGEIYNYDELAEGLVARGHVLKTRCDTEVVAHLYEDHGPDLVSRLDGMFALAVWDTQARRLLLARDRAGEKPLYYARCGSRLLFASELQALLACPEISRELDAPALALYLRHDHYPSPATPLRQIRKLPAAHRLVADASGLRIERYWSLKEAWEAPEFTDGAEALAERLLALLSESVRRRWRSDVPAGVFLSGGLDSGTIAGIVSNGAGGPVRTFTLGFEDSDFDESPMAAETARGFGCVHAQEVAGFPQLQEALEALGPRMADPLADPSLLPAWLISRLARRDVTVILSGEGSDEVFGGYPTYPGHILAGRLALVPYPLRRALGAALGRLPAAHGNHAPRDLVRMLLDGVDQDLVERHLAWFGSIGPALQRRLVNASFREAAGSWEPDAAARAAVASIHFRDALSEVMHLDISTYLQDGLLTKMDRASMLHSLEVRTPFLDHHLMEFGARLPSGQKASATRTKILLRRAVAGFMPREVLRRRKRGFAIPLAKWIDAGAGGLLAELLDPARLRTQGLFDPATVQQLRDEHLARRADHRRALWNLLVFQIWHAHFIDRPVPAARPVASREAMRLS